MWNSEGSRITKNTPKKGMKDLPYQISKLIIRAYLVTETTQCWYRVDKLIIGTEQRIQTQTYTNMKT